MGRTKLNSITFGLVANNTPPSIVACANVWLRTISIVRALANLVTCSNCANRTTPVSITETIVRFHASPFVVAILVAFEFFTCRTCESFMTNTSVWLCAVSMSRAPFNSITQGQGTNEPRPALAAITNTRLNAYPISGTIKGTNGSLASSSSVAGVAQTNSPKTFTTMITFTRTRWLTAVRTGVSQVTLALVRSNAYPVFATACHTSTGRHRTIFASPAFVAQAHIDRNTFPMRVTLSKRSAINFPACCTGKARVADAFSSRWVAPAARAFGAKPTHISHRTVQPRPGKNTSAGPI